MFCKSMFIILVIPVFLISFLSAQDTPAIEVEEMVFCTGIEERQPVGADTSFLNTVEQVYCFTKINGAQDTTQVSHIWYFNDQEMAKIELNIRSKSWRTWSSKRIMSEWTGTWRVDVVSSTEAIIESKEFVIKSAE